MLYNVLSVGSDYFSLVSHTVYPVRNRLKLQYRVLSCVKLSGVAECARHGNALVPFSEGDGWWLATLADQRAFHARPVISARSGVASSQVYPSIVGVPMT